MSRLLIVFSLTIAACVAQAETLPAVLSRMDAGAAKFQAMQANLKMTTHTAILDDDTVESGDIKMQKTSTETRALLDFNGEKDQRTIAFGDKSIQVYYPNVKLVQIYNVGRQSNVLDQFLLLGFGTSGKDLAKSYDIKLLGGEAINGQDTSHLELTPKSSAVLEIIAKAEVWLPLNSPYPVQQKFYFPSGDYRLVTYTGFQLNPAFPQGLLKLQIPSGVKVTRQ